MLAQRRRWECWKGSSHVSRPYQAAQQDLRVAVVAVVAVVGAVVGAGAAGVAGAADAADAAGADAADAGAAYCRTSFVARRGQVHQA